MPLRYRPAQLEDGKQITEWIAADPAHAGRCKPDFWLPQAGVACFVVEDEKGPIFFVRGETLLRLHIQFAPQSEKRRTAVAIDKFVPYICEQARKKNYRQIIYESVFDPLIQFLEKRGFRKSPNEQVLEI